MLDNFYLKFIIPFPKRVLSLIIILIVILGSFALKLEIDASANTLLLENDKDLKFAREVASSYKTEDFLVVTFKPKTQLLSVESLKIIKDLSDDLSKLQFVNSVTSILNVPLLQSPVKPIQELLKKIPTLQDKNIDKNLVKQEFLTSPLYKKYLVSSDFKITAILINLKPIATKEQNHQNILAVRQVLKQYETKATINLGGVSMIADDLITFVKSDLETFSLVVLGLLVFILLILFKKLKWVFIPLVICFSAIAITSGILGLFDIKITVISSNFISLQLIMTMSLVIHLIIKYKELLNSQPSSKVEDLVFDVVKSMIKPSFFVVITTIAGFSSLVFSDILPVINFGWMMSLGIVVSLVLTFILFPILVLLFDNTKDIQQDKDYGKFTTALANFGYKNQKMVLFIALVVVVFSITGASKLFVENSFINYFKKDTQIYKGMKTIDESLGGTTPLDVIITFKDDKEENITSTSTSEEDSDLDSFDDEFSENSDDETYWFTTIKMEKIKKVHNYLDSLPQIGKVLSLSTMNEIGKIIYNGKYLDSFELALLNKKLPEKYKKILISPYVNIEKNQARITARIIDSQPNLRRDELIKKINKDLSKILNPKTEEFRLSNLLILYNNMLQSLFDSQIKTIGVVVAILFLMFLLLFKNIKIAIVAILANVVPVGVIFGFMGLMKIPLDMMTITIAAISIGIAVDDTIHYIYRFLDEYKKVNNYKEAILNSHKSIGIAMFYTSLIIITGFSTLVLSNFIPTIYFGLLTIMAMFMAIVADLILLPVLLVVFRPFKESK